MTRVTTARFASTLVVCRDVVRSRDFYRDVFGLSVAADGAPDWADMTLGRDLTLSLYKSNGSLRVARGSIQLAFIVPDVDRFITDARLVGATVLQEPYDEPGGRVAVVSDPDGYPLRIFAAR